MEGYKVIEAAVRQLILDQFSDLLTEETCQQANLDGVFQGMLAQDSTYGCVLDYSDGKRQPRPPFREDIWVWEIMGFFMVRYRDNPVEHEGQVRDIITRLSKIFETGDRRLGGLVPLANITAIGMPQPETINQIPLYWMPFSIEVIDK